jgi:SAM-dependent methyltransferase
MPIQQESELSPVLKTVESCPICRSTKKTVIYPSTLDSEQAEAGVRLDPYAAHYAINRCLGCGLLLSNPVLIDSRVKQLYDHAETTNVLEGEEENVRRTMAGYYRLVQPHLRGRQRMLDVGCDMGFLLDVAARDGFEELHGIEPNPKARGVAEALPGTVISDKFYEDQDYPPESFDLITLIHVLDHVFDPREILERAWGHLRPGGILLAVVHNVRSLLGLLLGERFPVFNLYHHYFFSKQTLRGLCESAGFDVPDVVSTKNCYSLRFFVHKLPLMPGVLKRGTCRALSAVGLGSVALTLPVGNIGVIARRP